MDRSVFRPRDLTVRSWWLAAAPRFCNLSREGRARPTRSVCRLVAAIADRSFVNLIPGVTIMTTSRRQFLRSLGLLPGAAFLAQYHALAAAEKGKTKIRDIKVMMLQGPRTYTLVKVESDAGLYGIGEAYGSPGVGVKEGILALKPELIGKDPLGIDALMTGLGWRTDGSAHMLIRAASGIEMALWDLAGKTLGVPTTTLLGGKFRDRVRMYDHAAPRDMMDPSSCREWADRVKSDPSGFTAHKFGFDHTDPRSDPRTRPVQPGAHDHRAVPDPPGVRELPRGARLGPRHHGPLSLGV